MTRLCFHSFDGGLDAAQSWEDMLSMGEQQRLGFARLLFHKPAYAFMVRV